jgi:hypothetical protein
MDSSQSVTLSLWLKAQMVGFATIFLHPVGIIRLMNLIHSSEGIKNYQKSKGSVEGVTFPLSTVPKRSSFAHMLS